MPMPERHEVTITIRLSIHAATGLVAAMRREFTVLLGRRVDLAVKPALKPRIRAGVLAEARLIYEA